MKKETRSIFLSLALVASCATAAGLVTSAVSKKYAKEQSPVYVAEKGQPFSIASQTAMAIGKSQPVDLTEAAEKTVHGVVHIKSTVAGRSQVIQEMDWFDFFFGNGSPRQRRIESQPQVGYGSGVILSNDGYIVTNNHVIEKADEIEVTLNDSRTFKAKIIGTDSNSDLALLKIDCDGLPFIPMGDSDDLKLGEWVLAVGNPFNLTSTVTAGVVSAKARKIGIYDGGESIESFIQTDAAINMGNSGGALVNVNGELVGINSALESPTGTYAGYGFAIPTTIVKKVVADLKEYGSVQRALLGIMGGDVAAMRQLDENKDKDFGSVYEGVYVSEVTDGGGALEAGIKSGDIITEVDGRKVRTMVELQELLMQYRPGDKVAVTVTSDKKTRKVTVELKNSRGNTDVLKKSDKDLLGATFTEVPDNVRRSLNLGYGIMVQSLENGAFKKAGISKGFIILKINNRQIRSQEDVNAVYEEAQNSPDQVLFITGVYQNGRRANYAVGLSEE